MLIRNILVASDFSEHASAALEEAIELARKSSARIHLLHACTLRVIAAPDEPCAWTPDVFELAEDMARLELAALTRRVIRAGIPCESRISVLSASAAILQAARELPADLIVMGARGGGRLKNLMFSGVAGHVVRCAPCPVMTVRAPFEAAPRPALRALVTH